MNDQLIKAEIVEEGLVECQSGYWKWEIQVENGSIQFLHEDTSLFFIKETAE